MKVGDYCKRGVSALNAKAGLVEAAQAMRDEHVGFLVVFDAGDDLRKPVGVLTDRDIVLQIVAREVDPLSVSVGDVMTRNPLIATETDELDELLQGMRTAGVRRAPVVDSRGALTGIIAIDDVIGVMNRMLADISGAISHERRHEWRARPAPPNASIDT